MRCNDFDTHIDEMLSGILHPDASQHVRQCERCTSHYRARATVQNSLRKLAAVAPSGPSRATDHAVMAAYRRLQQRRTEIPEPVSVAPAARLFSFPTPGLTPAWASRTWLTGAAAAAVVFAVLGSTVHLWNGVSVGNTPMIAAAPSTAIPQRVSTDAPRRLKMDAAHVNDAVSIAANSVARRLSPHPAKPSAPKEYQLEVAVASMPAASATKANARRPVVAYGETVSYDSAPLTQLSSNVAPVVRLSDASTASVAQSASSTWPGYSNLMYCDPVVCSGPMQVVHIKVPVGQVKPNLGQTLGNAFVNAEVVVGPDGVARAIRVAN